MKIMKKTFITLAILIITGIFSALTAQTTIDRLYDKYAGQKGFTSINISPEMFSLLSSLDTEDSAENAKEAQNIMEQLSGLKMLVYESDSLQHNQSFIDDVRELNKAKGFSELMSINSEDEVVRFLVKKGKDGKVSEMLMLVFDKNEAMVMSLTGDLDMSTISGISKSLDIKGVDKLEKLDEK